MTSLKSLTNHAPGMSTDIWGPPMWQWFHDIAVMMDQSKDPSQPKFVQFWYTAKTILPCRWCRCSFGRYLKKAPPQYPFVSWIFDIHHRVNRKLKKSTKLDSLKFQRKCQVYSSFAHSDTIWDIIFILLINYNPLRKQKHYQEFFTCFYWIMPGLVQYRQYDDKKLACFSDPDWYDFIPWADKPKTMVHFLHSYNQLHDHTLKIEALIHRYSKAIAYQDHTEIEQVCGQFIQSCQDCQNDDNDCLSGSNRNSILSRLSK
jgi:hypothetical protein